MDTIKKYFNSTDTINNCSINSVISSINTDNLICPHCSNNSSIVKNGKNKETQRYLCKHCGKSFVKNTNTPLYYSKKPLTTWQKYIILLMNSYSLRNIAKTLSLSLNTAFFWRHKILDAIRENNNNTKFSRDVEISKMSFKPSFKGNYSKENKIKLHDYLSTGLNICVLTSIDNDSHVDIQPVTEGMLKFVDVTKALALKIEKSENIITETFLPYHYLCHKYNKNHICMKGAILVKANTDKKYNLNNIYEIQHNVHSFLKPFRGVSTKYLANYLFLFKYLKEKITSDVLLLKGSMSFIERNFKMRMPIFA